MNRLPRIKSEWEKAGETIHFLFGKPRRCYDGHYSTIFVGREKRRVACLHAGSVCIGVDCNLPWHLVRCASTMPKGSDGVSSLPCHVCIYACAACQRPKPGHGSHRDQLNLSHHLALISLALKTLMRCPSLSAIKTQSNPRTAVGYFRGGVTRGMDQPWCSSYDRPLRVPTKGIHSGKGPPTRAGPVLSLTLGRAQAQSPCSANHAARICKADGGSEVGVPRTLGWHGIFLPPTTLATTGSTDVAQMAQACSD